MFLTQPSSFSSDCPVSPGFRPSPAHLPGTGSGGNVALEMLKSPSEALFLIVFLLSVWSEGVGEGTADRNHLTTIPMLKAGTTLQVSKAFLGCRAHAQAKFQQFQGQRRFAWYLNFKATLGALPINPTQSAQPPLLPHHHSMQCTPSLFCIALHWKMKKKLEYSQFVGRYLGSKALLQS